MIVEWFTPSAAPALEWFGEATGTLATIEAQGTSAVASVVGPGGLKGDAGTDYGYLFVSDGGSAQSVSSARVALRNDGSFSINRLSAPFTSSIVSSAGVIQPVAVDDVMKIVVRLSIVPTLINTDFKLELDIGGTFGVIDPVVHRLGEGAGVEHVRDFVYEPFMRDTFLANGGTFYASADTEVSVIAVDYRVYPRSHA